MGGCADGALVRVVGRVRLDLHRTGNKLWHSELGWVLNGGDCLSLNAIAAEIESPSGRAAYSAKRLDCFDAGWRRHAVTAYPHEM